MTRAYSVLEVKALDDERRIIRGIASTPQPDRRGDILEPLGATFANPVPLLLHHDGRRPVGSATLEANADGILFEASFGNVETPGPLKDRIDEAWQSVKAKLIRGVSIGFRPLKNGMKFMKDGGIHFLSTEVMELSLVTIPQNVDASILSIKQYDAKHLAAFGGTLSGDSDPLPIVKIMAAQTTAEQIKAFETTRTTKDDRVKAIMQTAADAGVTLDGAQSEEYDGLVAEIKSIDTHLGRLRDYAATQPLTPVQAVVPPDVPIVRPPVIQVKSTIEPWRAFVRMVQTKAMTNGDSYAAIEWAKQWRDSTPEVELYFKAATVPGTTTDSAWAGPLAQYTNMASAFLDLLRPKTIIGQISGWKRVPFLTNVPAQTAGGTYGWVGQGAPKPVGQLAFTTVQLGIAKAAGIIAITKELAQTSSPDAEETIKNDMVKGIAAYLDLQFVDPTVAATSANPASITNGITPITSTDDPLRDLHALLGALSTANVPLAGVVLIMSETNALGMGMLRDANGNRMFPGVGPTGGTAEGISIVASNAAGDKVIALQPGEILYADGGIEIDVSDQASLQMDSAPTTPTATTVLISLWQHNLIGLRAERMINWKRGRDVAVQFTTGASFAPTLAAASMAARSGGTAKTPAAPSR